MAAKEQEMQFELHREVIIAGGSAASFNGNISTYHNTAKNTTFAAIAHRYQVNMVSWDAKLEGFQYDTLIAKDQQYEAPSVVTQVKYVRVKSRTQPIMVVCTMDGFLLFEVDNKSPLTWQPIQVRDTDSMKYAKGIGVSGNCICIGDHEGVIHPMTIGDQVVKVKPTVHEHKTAIVDIKDEGSGETMVSASADGLIIIWDNNVKPVNKISTGQPITTIACLRRVVLCGTALGQILVYSSIHGELLAEIMAHARIVTDLQVLAEKNLLLSCSEDTFVRVWKVNANKAADAVQIECVYSHHIENAPLVGCCFNDTRATSFCVTAYDYASIFYFKIIK